jgi:hypothetical protein
MPIKPRTTHSNLVLTITPADLVAGDRFRYLSTPGTTYRVAAVGTPTAEGRIRIHVGGAHILEMLPTTELVRMNAKVETRTAAEAEAAGGNTSNYHARATCADCGYKGKWTGLYHAEDLRDAHVCGK